MPYTPLFNSAQRKGFSHQPNLIQQQKMHQNRRHANAVHGTPPKSMTYHSSVPGSQLHKKRASRSTVQQQLLKKQKITNKHKKVTPQFDKSNRSKGNEVHGTPPHSMTDNSSVPFNPLYEKSVQQTPPNSMTDDSYVPFNPLQENTPQFDKSKWSIGDPNIFLEGMKNWQKLSQNQIEKLGIGNTSLSFFQKAANIVLPKYKQYKPTGIDPNKVRKIAHSENAKKLGEGTFGKVVQYDDIVIKEAKLQKYEQELAKERKAAQTIEQKTQRLLNKPNALYSDAQGKEVLVGPLWTHEGYSIQPLIDGCNILEISNAIYSKQISNLQIPSFEISTPEMQALINYLESEPAQNTLERICNALLGLNTLYQIGLVHSDISYNNIMLEFPPENLPTEQKQAWTYPIKIIDFNATKTAGQIIDVYSIPSPNVLDKDAPDYKKLTYRHDMYAFCTLMPYFIFKFQPKAHTWVNKNAFADSFKYNGSGHPFLPPLIQKQIELNGNHQAFRNHIFQEMSKLNSQTNSTFTPQQLKVISYLMADGFMYKPKDYKSKTQYIFDFDTSPTRPPHPDEALLIMQQLTFPDVPFSDQLKNIQGIPYEEDLSEIENLWENNPNQMEED